MGKKGEFLGESMPSEKTSMGKSRRHAFQCPGERRTRELNGAGKIELSAGSKEKTEGGNGGKEERSTRWL